MSTGTVTGVEIHRRTDATDGTGAVGAVGALDAVGMVDVGELRCPGCDGPVDAEPPSGWPAAAGRAPEFSHRDGSVLCPDGRGRIGEPVELGRRYWLTAAGRAALDAAGGAPVGPVGGSGVRS